MSDWNDKVIADFRASGGQVGGQFAGAPLLLLHSTGAKSGQPRVSPVMYQATDGGWSVFASYAGMDVNPAWYHNLKAHPDAEIEVSDGSGGIETVPVRARELDPEERGPIWEEQKERFPGFAEYEAKTDRVIPVLELARR